MEFLTRLGDPILDRIRTIPSHSRLAGIGLGLVVAIGLWLLIGRAAPREWVALLDGREFSEPQIARISSAFRKHRLEGAKISGRNIEIPAAQQNVYLMAVDAENAWPAEFDAPVERALAGANPLMPWQQSRESLQRGEKQMLARIVSEMSGIENAAVQYDEIRHPGFPPRIEFRAVVAVKAAGLRHLDLEEVEAIRDTVVAFKSGLERENVTITDLNACRAYPGNRAPDASHTAARALAAAKRAIEDQWQQKILERLHMYPDLTVAVNAHFNEIPAAIRFDGPSAPEQPTSMRLVQVTASIDVPKRYFFNVWRQRNHLSAPSAPPAEQIQQIEQEVCNTITRAILAILPPPAPGWETPHQVTVTSHDELLADGVQLAHLPRSTHWLRPVGIGVGIATVLAAALLVAAWAFRCRIVRCRVKATGRPTFTASESNESRRPLTVFGAESHSLVELQQQVATLVQQDPASAAAVLKQWLSRAA